jgi:hypothetical protein
MTKAMIIISAILLFAGVASAGSLSGLRGSGEDDVDGDDHGRNRGPSGNSGPGGGGGDD